MQKKIKEKNTNKKNRDFEKEVMSKVISGQVVMKPKWYFIMGSVLSLFGLVSLSITSVFLVSITIFLLKKQGPGRWRLEMMLDSFPLWIPVVAIIGIVGGIWFLWKYDFSYKKNMWYIVFGFIVSIIITAWIIDTLGFNEIWFRKGPMKRFYQQIEDNRDVEPKGRGNRYLRQNN